MNPPQMERDQTSVQSNCLGAMRLTDVLSEQQVMHRAAPQKQRICEETMTCTSPSHTTARTEPMVQEYVFR